MKKILSITIISLLFSFQAKTQTNLKFMTGNQEMILNAIDSALVIVKQEYVLQSVNDKSQRFGSNGKPYFGKSYTLGVISGNKIWFSKTVLTPWINDSNFTKYQKSDTLKPVLSKSYFRFVYQSKYTEIEQDSNLYISANDSLIAENLYANIELKNSLPGLKMDSAISREGWIVVAYSEKNIQENDTCSINFLIYRQKPDFQINTSEGKVRTPEPNGKIIGGAFIESRIKVGCIDFYLSGILHKNILNWTVVTTTIESKLNTIITKEPETITPILTPEKDSKKKTRKNK